MIYTIIVTYNGEKWIERCLRSLNDSLSEVSIIVIDNASKDDTCTIVRDGFPDVELITLQSNYGFGQANNIGIERAVKAGADFVFLLNQDTIIYNDTIYNLLSVFNGAPHDIGILSPMHLNDSGTALDNKFETYITAKTCPGYISDVTLGNLKPYYYMGFVNAAAWLIKTEVLKKTGMFSDAFFHYGEDSNFLQRLRFHGYKCAIVPAAYIHHFREERKGQFTKEHIKKEAGITFKIIILNVNKSYSGAYKDIFKYALHHLSKGNPGLFIKLLFTPFLKIRTLKKIRNSYKHVSAGQ